ncbi:MAG: enoyl-CoA hydratase/isomerase family protein [Calditerrivibrio sp.]|nr:enoyl-CoA hydratase/isomerase family protein [Calditerrivibrio sp.]
MIDFNIVHETANITLIPEERFNILNPDVIKQLINILEIIKDSEAKTIVIYGRGGSFAVGANIKQMYEYDGFMAKGFSILGNKLFGLMDSIPQVIIAQIDGFCMGGGIDFAASCTIRLATISSKFAHPGAQLGVITGFGGTQRLPRIMKPNAISDFFLFGQMYDAKYMYEARFLDALFDDFDSMKSYTDGLVRKINEKNKVFLKELKSFGSRGCGC